MSEIYGPAGRGWPVAYRDRAFGIDDETDLRILERLSRALAVLRSGNDINKPDRERLFQVVSSAFGDIMHVESVTTDYEHRQRSGPKVSVHGELRVGFERRLQDRIQHRITETENQILQAEINLVRAELEALKAANANDAHL